MKKILILALGSAAVAAAAPAAAQSTSSTGTVNVTGNVAGRCSVVASAGSALQAFTGTIALGALDESDGTLATSLENTTSAAPGAAPVSTRIVCTSASVGLSITSDTLASGSRTAAPETGYASQIDYVAEMQVGLAAGGNGTVTYDTAVGGAPGTATVGRLAATGQNVTVRAHGFKSRGGPSSLLVAGDYTSTITVNIQPAA
ncbi:MAG: hypothetical protein NTX28_11350 [Novosphingobium sp.]|nr:hypothetical protein [Novosphingobium sp.]